MLTIKLALRTLSRRKGRMALIGALVAFGTFLIVFGTIFASSASVASKASIIDNFTGDFIVYSDRSKDLPSPFAFSSPLPRLRDADAVEKVLDGMPGVETYAPYAQSYGVVQAEHDGKKIDLPLIFYAVEPKRYLSVFGSVDARGGGFFGSDTSAGAGSSEGIMISDFQNDAYERNYGFRLKADEKVTLLGITEGGVNTYNSKVVGIFKPAHFTSVFNYINFMDASTFSRVYDYTGVQALPKAFDSSLAKADSNDESAIFGLAGDSSVSSLDVASLKSEALSGATMIAVRLKDHSQVDKVMAQLDAHSDLGIKTARWDLASGFYAQIAAGLQAFIYVATGLIFLVVALIFMNTLIINVTERTAEIGTMRAIGAEKSFVRRLFLAESLTLNLFSSLIGMIASLALIFALGKRGLMLPEIISQFLIGGGPLPLYPSIWPFLLGIVVVAVVSILATIYPVRVATSITPLKAMSDK